jgi:hypothetical protein
LGFAPQPNKPKNHFLGLAKVLIYKNSLLTSVSDPIRYYSTKHP